MSEVLYLIDLPAPPAAVADALWHWQEYLRFLPSAGPRKQALCAGIEREYHHITRKLQAQYHDAEPNASIAYDYFLGEQMEAYIHELSPARREIVIGVHLKHLKVSIMLRTIFKSLPEGRREEKFTNELRSAYDALAGKLCRKK